MKLVLLIFLALCLCSYLVAETWPNYVVQQLTKTNNGYVANLQLQGGQGPFGGDANQLKVLVEFQTDNRLRVKITDANYPRWEVPNIVQSGSSKLNKPNYNFQISNTGSRFWFAIQRVSDGASIFNTSTSYFSYEDQFLSIGTSLTSTNPNIYGLGERIHAFRLDPNNKVYTIFARDRGTPVDQNLYGSHPFYMEMRPGGAAHGVFLLNSNAMDVRIDGPNQNIQYNVIGGVLDFYFFLGPTPTSVIQQYQELIGKPYMPPLWALGFHQCRWGYNSVDNTQQVVENFRQNNLPLDSIWNDIDYMDAYKDFTTDPTNFPLSKVKAFTDSLKTTEQHYVTIVDPGILVEDGYDPYETGLKMDAFIKRNDGKTPLRNKVWPGITVFPDFSSTNGQQYWTQYLSKFMQETGISGIWIDMNEPAGFCDGECGYEARKEPYQTKNNLKFNPNYPPYVPGPDILNAHTISMDSIWNVSITYNAHSLYGYLESIATRKAIEQTIGKRAFLLSRSTFANSGQHTAHWLGDNNSEWPDMYYSMTGILSMNMFGIPLVGADICGFAGDTTAELCTRWMQLGSMYPFSRNHNSIGMQSQEPYVFGDQITKINSKVLMNRYSLLPYFYTLFFNAHTKGGMIWNPMFFEFGSDSDPNMPYLDRQILVGRALMVTPVLTQGANSVSAYIPDAILYDYYTGQKVSARKQWVTLNAPFDTLPIHIRGGFIVPKQQPALTSAATSRQSFQLLIALDDNGSALGELFVDDGESLNSIENVQYTYMTFSAKSNANGGSITSTVSVSKYTIVPSLNTLTIYGVPKAPCSVVVDQQTLSKNQFQYDATNDVLTIIGFAHNLNQNLAASWSYSCSK